MVRHGPDAVHAAGVALQLQGDLRPLLGELRHESRQPLGGDAGKDAQLDAVLLVGPGRLVEPVLLLLDADHEIQQLLPGLGQGDPPLGPVEQLDAQIAFQIVDDIPETGMTVAQLPGGPVQAAAAGGHDDGEVLSHGMPLLFGELRRFFGIPYCYKNAVRDVIITQPEGERKALSGNVIEFCYNVV